MPRRVRRLSLKTQSTTIHQRPYHQSERVVAQESCSALRANATTRKKTENPCNRTRTCPPMRSRIVWNQAQFPATAHGLGAGGHAQLGE